MKKFIIETPDEHNKIVFPVGHGNVAFLVREFEDDKETGGTFFESRVEAEKYIINYYRNNMKKDLTNTTQ